MLTDNRTKENRRILTLIALALMLLIIPVTARTEEIAVGHFSGEGLAGWKPKSFQGVTDYRLVTENSKTVVRATSHASASGLIKKISFEPKKYRYLRWSWKIRQTVGGDEKRKQAMTIPHGSISFFPASISGRCRHSTISGQTDFLRARSSPAPMLPTRK